MPRIIRSREILFIGSLLVLAWFAAGCAGFSAGGSQTPTALQPGAILFADDFSNVPSGWGTWDRKGGLVTYEQGGLRILVNELNFDYWSVAGKKFGDLRLEVDASRLAGSTDNDFGLICRYQDNRNFYMFLVSSDGYYGIAKLKDDQHSLIGMEQLQYNAKIQANQGIHHVEAGCVGDTLSFAVDGLKLLEVHDGDFSNGDVGLVAGAYSNAGVDILFDNFKVKQP